MKQLKFIFARLHSVPFEWSIGPIKVHISLAISLVVVSSALFALSLTNANFFELRSIALTLPCIWMASVAFRSAVQYVALGQHIHELDFVVGPTGNITTDYEHLPRGRILVYGCSGQTATLLLGLLGLVVAGVASPYSENAFAWQHAIDFQGGWSAAALGTQVMCFNFFLFGLHLIPAVPFDARAVAFGGLSPAESTFSLEPRVFYGLSQLDSHAAAAALGVGGTLAGISLLGVQYVEWWYCAAAAGGYLWVASRWEVVRAQEIEQRYSPFKTQIERRDMSEVLQGGHFQKEGQHQSQAQKRSVESKPSQAQSRELQALSVPDTEVDIDEILRKIHREGADSLSSDENAALLSASEKLKKNREQS